MMSLRSELVVRYWRLRSGIANLLAEKPLNVADFLKAFERVG